MIDIYFPSGEAIKEDRLLEYREEFIKDYYGDKDYLQNKTTGQGE